MGLILSLDNSIHSFNRAGFVGLLDQYTGAAAGYSLRKLSVNTTNVIRVRRSSDNAEADFTASDITDGTLLSFVNQSVEKVLNGDFSNGSTNWIVSNGSVTGGEYVSGTLSAYQSGIKQVPFTYTGTGTLTFDLTLNSGSLRVDDGGSLKLFTSSGSQSITLTNPSKLEFNAYNLGFDGIIDNISFIPTNVDGYVTTWYDQSGNSNDATQATAASQPKIVNAGVLVEENGRPAVDFDGVNDDLDISVPITSGFSFFGVYKNTKDGSYLLGSSNAQFGRRSTSEYRFHAAGSFSANGGVHSNNQVLLTGIEDTVNATIYANGTQQSQASSVFSSDTLTLISRINVNGNIQEVIIYNSDQSANRAAIETNINTFYSIYP